MARERLCLRGTTDYRINGLDGAPFFVLTQAVNPGLIAVLRQSIVPRLLAPDGVKGQISTFNNFSICFALPCNERSFLSRF